MELKSFAYIAFAIAVILLYYSFSRVKYAQNIVLFCASMFFVFVSSGVSSVILILILVSFVYGMGILIEKKRKQSKQAARPWMYIGVFAVIGLLCYFKFFKFTYTMLQNLLAKNDFVLSDLITPIGISYYSLTMIAYMIDIYHKKHPAERNYLYFVTFVTYFPCIVEGPINLYKKMNSRFKVQHQYNSEDFRRGFLRCIWGFFKKVVIADRIGILVCSILDAGYTGPINLLAIVLYSFQIYGDFSGGIDIVMGISEMMGIKLNENFRSPLVAKSVTDFWQRWHMTLGEFMEKFIYYPIVLGKNTRKLAKKIRNDYLQKVFAATVATIIVFVVVGIWHGTGWNYVAYGCYQAFWMSTAILLAPVYKSVKEKCHINDKSTIWNSFVSVRTFFVLLLGRFLTRAKDLDQAISWIKRSFVPSIEGVEALVKNELGLDRLNVLVMLAGIALLIGVDIANEKGYYVREHVMKKNVVFRYIVYFVGIFATLIFGIYGAEFTTSSFIYGGF